MAHIIRKIQREDVKVFIDQCDQSKPIVPVILDDSGLPIGEKGRRYVRAFFSNPEKMGVRCVVSNKCKRFLKFVSEDEELRRKVEFVNFYLADGIQDTANGEKKCTVYIVPDYSFGKQMFVSLFRTILDYAEEKIAWIISFAVFWVANLVRCIFNLFVEFPDVLEKIEVIEFLYDFTTKENVSIHVCMMLAVCIFMICAVLAPDRLCANAVGQLGDNIVFLVPHIGRFRSVVFAIRWIYMNKFYRKDDGNSKKCRSFCITDNEKSLRTRDDVCPIKIFQFGENAEDGYRFLLAVLEHYSSLEQELILKYHKEPQ